MKFPGSGRAVVVNDDRILFDLAPYSDESFLGFTARLGAWNCFNGRSHFLKSIGFQDLSDGGFREALADSGQLAWRLRVSEDELGRLVAREDDEGERYRAQLSLQARQVSPAGLRAEPYHRSSWANPLLPYCPESWDLLIDQCPSEVCGARLGWGRVMDADACEHCGFDLKTAITAKVPESDRAALTMLADLVGRDPAKRRMQRDRLPTVIAEASPFDLFDLALAFARASSIAKVKSHYQRATPSRKAQFLADGMRLIADYPASYDELFAKSNNRLPDVLREAKKSLPRHSRVKELYQALYHDWTPCPHGPSRIRMQREESGQLTLREAAKILRLENANLRTLIDDGMIKAPQSRGAVRQHQWLDPGEVDALAHRLANRMSVSEFCRRYHIPTPGLAQLVELKLIQLNDDPAITALHGRSQLRRDSVDAFTLRLSSVLRFPPRDTPLLALEDLFHGIGAQHKPWGAILQAALCGGIPIYFDGHLSEEIDLRKASLSATLARDVLARRRLDLLALPRPTSYRVFGGYFTRVEAESYLNCFPRDLSWLISAIDLDRRLEEREVNALAKMFITSREISWRWRVSPKYRDELPTTYGIRRMLGPFWPRREIERHFNSIFPEGAPV